jgi:hypothetical protein
MGAHLEDKRPAAEEPQVAPRERVPVDVEEVFVFVHLLARGGRRRDAVLLLDEVGVAVLGAQPVVEARKLDVHEVLVLAPDVDEPEPREGVVVFAVHPPAGSHPTPVWAE